MDVLTPSAGLDSAVKQTNQSSGSGLNPGLSLARGKRDGSSPQAPRKSTWRGNVKE